MTKNDILEQIEERLGDSSAGFTTILGKVFDRVLEELAANECIGQLRKEASYQFTAGTTSYDAGTICGLSAGPPQVYPIRVEKLHVPSWGFEGRLEKVEDEGKWDALIATYGATLSARPKWWRVYPNETQIQAFPVPTSDDTTASALKVLHWAPPAALGVNDNIAEIRNENLHVIIAGCVWYGLVFQDETLVDKDRALVEWRTGMAMMKGQQRRARYGDVQRIRFRD